MAPRYVRNWRGERDKKKFSTAPDGWQTVYWGGGWWWKHCMKVNVGLQPTFLPLAGHLRATEERGGGGRHYFPLRPPPTTLPNRGYGSSTKDTGHTAHHSHFEPHRFKFVLSQSIARCSKSRITRFQLPQFLLNPLWKQPLSSKT